MNDRQFIEHLNALTRAHLAGQAIDAPAAKEWPWGDRAWSDPDELGRVQLKAVSGPGGLIAREGETIEQVVMTQAGPIERRLPIPRFFYIPEALELISDPVIRGDAQMNVGSTGPPPFYGNRAHVYKTASPADQARGVRRTIDFQLQDTLATNDPVDVFVAKLFARAEWMKLGVMFGWHSLRYNEAQGLDEYKREHGLT